MGVPTVTVEKDHASPAPYDAFLHGLDPIATFEATPMNRRVGWKAEVRSWLGAGPLCADCRHLGNRELQPIMVIEARPTPARQAAPWLL
jgi:hypothetical protein